MRQQHFLWAWWTLYIKLCASTQNVSGKTISLSCCFQHVSHVFVGSVFYRIRPVLLVSTSRAFHALDSPCHLSTVDWLIPACSQLLTPVFSTHLLIFRQASLSLLSSLISLLFYWSSLGGAPCKQSQSYFIISNLSLWCQQESSQLIYCKHCLSWQSSLFSCILCEENSICIVSISVIPFALTVYYCCELQWQSL